MRATRRTIYFNLDSTGDKEYTAYDLPVIDAGDYWTNVTGIPCPVANCEGTILHYEAGYVPGYRICSHCQRHFLAEGDAEHPYLIDTGRNGCLPEHEEAFAAMRRIPPPSMILDTRIPIPGRDSTSAHTVPEHIAEKVRSLMRERNTCSDERVDEIDSTILYLLSPFTKRV